MPKLAASRFQKWLRARAILGSHIFGPAGIGRGRPRFRGKVRLRHRKEPGTDNAEGSEAPANELEALVTDLSASGPVVLVFGNGWLTTHLVGATRPLFRGPSERRWWHVEHGDPGSNWALDVRLDQVERVRFSREVSSFASLPGQESLVVRFEADDENTALHCYLGDLYEGRLLRPERLRAWEELRSRYGGRDESLVLDGSLRSAVPAA
jgi:hypothetical protein